MRGWPLRSGRRRPGAFSRPREHRRLRGIEEAHPGRVSCKWNVETPSGSGATIATGGLTVREAELLGGNRTVQEANAGRSKGHRKPRRKRCTSMRLSGVTGRIPDVCRARKGADVDRVSL